MYRRSTAFVRLWRTTAIRVVVIVAAFTAACSATSARAATGTWTGGNGGTWNATEANWSGLPAPPLVPPGQEEWDSTNGPTHTALFATANDFANLSGIVFPGALQFDESATVSNTGLIGFENLTSSKTIDVASTKTGTINADFLVSGIPGGGSGNKIFKTGAGILILAGNTTLVGDADASFTAGFTVEEGGELRITGDLKAASGTQAGTRSNADNLVGSTSANNTLTISGAGSVYGGGLFVGEGAFGGNNVVMSAPGTSGSPSYIMQGNGKQLHLGTSSSGNSLTVSNGAYLLQGGGGGTRTWFIGTNAGANNNAMLITGEDLLGNPSTVDFTTNAAINVGGAGDGNSLTVSAGGYLEVRKILLGQNGGDNNIFLATGGGTSFVMSASDNTIFEVGSVNGSVGNSATVAAGATGTYNELSGVGRAFAIGKTSGANDNYLLVTGNGSIFSVTHVQPVSVGGQTTSNTVTDSTASGNHIDVYSGGALNVAATTSVYIMGVDSAFNLGDGTGISAATVGASGGSFVAGLFLKNADGRLNVNNGRLTANAGGTLASGLGMVDLIGDGRFSTAFGNSQIASQITGVGDLIKEGSGTLELTQVNSYTGDTRVNAGILQLDQVYLADTGDVIIAINAMMNLAFGGVDTVNALSLGGVGQGPGTYGATGSGASFINDTYFTGSGVLNVLNTFGGGDIPAPMALPAGLALMAMIVSRRRR